MRIILGERAAVCRPADTVKPPAAYRPLLASGRWFAQLDAALQAALLDAARTRALAPGERLFSRGDPPGGLYAVVAGALRVSGVAPSGKEAVLALLEPPTWFGEISVVDGLPRTHDATADGEVVVLEVPPSALEAVMAADPLRWRALAQLMAAQLRLVFVALEDLALQPPLPRLARRLVLMARGYGQAGGATRRVIELRQEQLAQMLAVSRQTANQLLKELEARGVVRVDYGELEILDLAALERVGEG